MNEPVKVGDVVGPVREPVKIPKRCPECGAEYEGYSFIGLRPGEIRAIYPCDDCMVKQEEAARERLKQQFQEPPEEATELHRPERVRRDWDD